jgi:hypothetical protein
MNPARIIEWDVWAIDAGRRAALQPPTLRIDASLWNVLCAQPVRECHDATSGALVAGRLDAQFTSRQLQGLREVVLNGSKSLPAKTVTRVTGRREGARLNGWGVVVSARRCSDEEERRYDDTSLHVGLPKALVSMRA